MREQLRANEGTGSRAADNGKPSFVSLKVELNLKLDGMLARALVQGDLKVTEKGRTACFSKGKGLLCFFLGPSSLSTRITVGSDSSFRLTMPIL